MQTASETGTSVLREAHLRDYWKIVWQGRWTILAVFVAVVGATAAWTFLQTPIYSATAIVEVQPQARRLLSSSDASGLGAAGEQDDSGHQSTPRRMSSHRKKGPPSSAVPPDRSIRPRITAPHLGHTPLALPVSL